MKSKTRFKLILIMGLGVLCGILIVNNSNIRYYPNSQDIIMEGSIKLNPSKYYIYINNNWTAAKSAGICTGYGTYSEPYVIKDLVINGGGSGTLIWIVNSTVYFRIENCTLHNAYYGINLQHVNNSEIRNNKLSSLKINGITLNNGFNNTFVGNRFSDNYFGMYLLQSDDNLIEGNTFTYNDAGLSVNGNNNTISGNTLNHNNDGISLGDCYNNHILNNHLNHNEWGMWIYYCTNNTFSGNLMSFCGVHIQGSVPQLISNSFDATNLVNGKTLYYYSNQDNLGPDNFSNAGQIILVDCHESLISDADTSYATVGISLLYCLGVNITDISSNHNFYGMYFEMSNNSVILLNRAKNNRVAIYLSTSNYNLFLNNDLLGSNICFRERICEGNTFKNNICVNKIPGYNIYYLSITFLLILILIRKKIKTKSL